ncbi:MAG: hypothetical protein JSS32_02545 [Verrucomicrobia bacterium]|nr:hypothetical protein [Verrucomicrobiota bacterium]
MTATVQKDFQNTLTDALAQTKSSFEPILADLGKRIEEMAKEVPMPPQLTNLMRQKAVLSEKYRTALVTTYEKVKREFFVSVFNSLPPILRADLNEALSERDIKRAQPPTFTLSYVEKRGLGVRSSSPSPFDRNWP